MKHLIQHVKGKTLREILWNNTGARQTIAKNTFWLGLSEFSINILKFVLLVYAARVLGDTGFGEFAYVSSFVAVFGIFFDLGISEAVTREFAKDSHDQSQIATLFSLKIFLGLVSGAGLLIASFFIGTQGEVLQMVMLIMTGYMFLASLSGFFYAIFRARQKMQLEFFPTLFQNLGIAISGFTLLFFLPRVTSLAFAYLIGTALIFVPNIIYFHRKIAPLRFHIEWKTWKHFLVLSYPMALVGVVSVALYSNIDSIMLGSFGHIQENGWYNAAYRVITFALLPMSFISQSFYPALSRSLHQADGKLDRLWSTQFQALMIIGIPMLFGGYALAGPIIQFLYPAEFQPASQVLKILMLTAMIMYAYNPFRQILIVCNEQRKVFRVFLVGMVINIAMNFFMIPWFSLYGAAISTLIAQGAVLVGLIILTRSKTSIRIMEGRTVLAIGSATGASLLMFFVLESLKQSTSIFWLVGVGIVVYILAFSIIYFVINQLYKKPYESQE